MQQTERTRIRNHPERAVPEQSAEILSQGVVAHVGFVEDELPYVKPLSYHYDRIRRRRFICMVPYAAAQ